MHTDEPSVPQPRTYELETATEKLERYNLPGTDKILAELIQAEGNVLCSENHRPITSNLNKENFTIFSLKMVYL
jgi:hypothetical protein